MSILTAFLLNKKLKEETNMADIHQLGNKMRSLKLNSMVDTLDLRLSQAQKDVP